MDILSRMTKRSRKRKEGRIVPKLVFDGFDGTWHGGFDNSKETVVSRLPGLISNGPNGEEGRKIRVNGVGSDGLTDKILGGSIADDYNEQDRIILCGYSRGAWAARYLALVIERIGLVRDGDREFYKRLFKECDNDPYLSNVNKDKVRGNYKFCDDVKIDALCCFDTVGSLGVPLFGIAKPLSYLHRSKYQTKDIDRIPKNVDYAFHALALHEKRSPYSPTYMSGRNVHQVFFIGDHGSMGKIIGEHEDLVHAPLAWMVQQLSSHVSITFNEDKLKVRFPSYVSEEQAKIMSRQRNQGTSREVMMQHAWCCPSGSIPGAGVGKLVIMGRKDRDPGMVLKFWNSDYPDSSTDDSSRHEAASAHPEIHINSRGRQTCGFTDAVPGYVGVQPMDSSRVFFWKRKVTGGQEEVSASVLHEATVGFLEARLLGLPLKEASELSCCDLERPRKERINGGVSVSNGKAQRRQSTRIRVKKWFKGGFGASTEKI